MEIAGDYMNDRCKNCWWEIICKKTAKACNKVKAIDMIWRESPNNDRNKALGNNFEK